MKTERYYQTFLKRELSKRITANPRYSLRAFANSLEIDPSGLSRILNGQKRISVELSKRIAEKLDLTPEEANNFFLSTAMAYQEEDVKRVRPGIKEILKHHAARRLPEKDLAPEVFKVISDWYHYAILQLMEEKNFVNDSAWIAQQLSISQMEAKLAIERMIELELLVLVDGELKRTSGNLTSGDQALTTSAHKKRIRQITEKSIESLENDDINVRNHRTMTMAIDPELMPLAKEMIQDFMVELTERLQTKKTQVYELQINLFPLQRTKS